MICTLCLSQNTYIAHQKKDATVAARDYYACRNCSLIFLDPGQHLSASEEKERYDLHENDPSDSKYVSFLSRLTNPLLPFLTPGFSGLDFGCGPGPAISPMMREKGFSVSNYDPIYFPEAALLKTQYDFVTATEVVEHLQSPRETFELLDTLLKPKESYLAIMTQMLAAETTFETWWYHQEDTHVSFYGKKTFEWLSNWRGWSALFPADNVVIFKKKRGENRD